MLSGRTIWLACNEGSGSNDDAALEKLEAAFEKAEAKLHRRIRFPSDAAPSVRVLGDEAVDFLVIFAGDGTISALVAGLYGWQGSILVLPGGTMNLLSKRLHGDTDAAEIIARVASGQARRVRPAVIRCAGHDGLAGAVAGPATAWNGVREAMREASVGGFISAAAEAIGESRSGPMVACREPATGRVEGYAAIALEPHEAGITLKGYYADSLLDYLAQTVALARRDFREGPHDELGTHARVRLANVAGASLGLLVDGEPIETGVEQTFERAHCEVDLLATGDLADLAISASRGEEADLAGSSGEDAGLAVGAAPA